ncbi:hypothetical protein LCGC14_3022660 [marine sediment metagenome]|uniref:Uncharacterized protein n=1 Tax=marine sediment metagenome TaxID=412755 RepID=A0A0F8ZKY8_9ZZZZ
MDALTIKLMSLAVHAEEYINTGQTEIADIVAIEGLLADPEVVEKRREMDEMALLPVKR